MAWVRAAHAYAIVWEDGHRIRGLLHDEITGVALTPLKTISQAPINGRDQRADIVAVYGLGTVAVWDRTDPGQNEPSRIVARAQEWSGPFAPIGLEVEIESIPGGSGYLRAPKLTQSGEPDPATPQSTWTHRIVWERFWQIPAPGDTDIHHAVVLGSFVLSPATIIQQPATAVPGASDIGPNEVTPSIARIKIARWLRGAATTTCSSPSSHQRR